MKNTRCLLYMLILLLVVSTQETTLGPTEKAKTDFTIKVTQEVEPSSKKIVLLETKNISALLGKEATLVVNTNKESEIQDIQWVKNGINFATTKPKNDVRIRENSYKGKLRSTNDGSLVLQSLTKEDQGEYKADILLSDMKNYQIIYYLHISEEGASHRTHGVVASVIVVLVLLVILAGVAFMMWRKKRCFKSKKVQVRKTRSDPEGMSDEENKLNPKVSNPSPQEDTLDLEIKLHQKSSSPSTTGPCDKTNDNGDDEEFHDALEVQV
ncbi:uncharacterized protein LOC122921805 isoform X2 [Bufo gargarizans]|uniref:uncharacterized protein LOC122921805 isoform X2 n=1 Tax=Bufo gargarizans TaxID=30331 RepID=UPI001CF279A9|nr:uncharacterized protein LOC122921805 isoform X2 [Bufo gargarizans]